MQLTTRTFDLSQHRGIQFGNINERLARRIILGEWHVQLIHLRRKKWVSHWQFTLVNLVCEVDDDACEHLKENEEQKEIIIRWRHAFSRLRNYCYYMVTICSNNFLRLRVYFRSLDYQSSDENASYEVKYESINQSINQSINPFSLTNSCLILVAPSASTSAHRSSV
jgi:hypothetical protein